MAWHLCSSGMPVPYSLCSIACPRRARHKSLRDDKDCGSRARLVEELLSTSNDSKDVSNILYALRQALSALVEQTRPPGVQVSSKFEVLGVFLGNQRLSKVTFESFVPYGLHTLVTISLNSSS
eukprot:2806511-Amphidinium_carterae.1